MSGVTNIIAEIEGGPAGPDVGAFFEVDGTLIAGSTANVFHHAVRRVPPGQDR